VTKSLDEPLPELPAAEIAANRAAWLAALRSGNYPQTRRALRRGGSYCCLGVAEDVVDCTWIVRPSGLHDPATHLASHPIPRGGVQNVTLTTLTRVGASRLGLPIVPWVAYRAPREIGNMKPFWFTTTLVKLNDENRLTFAEIADVIDVQGEHWDGSWEQAMMNAKLLQRRDQTTS
jgi:hypothetical protein